jgi:hypothetical protein
MIFLGSTGKCNGGDLVGKHAYQLAREFTEGADNTFIAFDGGRFDHAY